VLGPLAGYLMLAQAMITDSTEAPTALNFAPDADSFRSVCDLVQAFSSRWGGRPGWRFDTDEHPHEASLLTLDATRARAVLGWRPLLSFEDAVTWTADGTARSGTEKTWRPLRAGRSTHFPSDSMRRRVSDCRCGARHEGRHPSRRLWD
jgi:hypothetical protein